MKRFMENPLGFGLPVCYIGLMSKPETVVYVEHDVEYLPQPNKVEIVITEELAPEDLTRTAFMVPVFDDGGILIAQNRRRGLEIAGGHIEGEETPEIAAVREAYEETGVSVKDVRPIGFLRMTSTGTAPEDYAYPFPLSYQQFFAARATGLDEDRIDDDECITPVKIYDTQDRRITRKTITFFGNAALKSVLGYLG